MKVRTRKERKGKEKGEDRKKVYQEGGALTPSPVWPLQPSLQSLLWLSVDAVM